MPSANNKRIAKNTIMLYFRMLLTTFVTMYTSRVVLITLGVNDFGIFNVVAGFVSMFQVINTSMSAATSRFLIYELGKKDYPQLKKVFNAALTCHIALALLVLLVAETVGLWFLMHKLKIPADRMTAAHWVFQFSIFSLMVTLTQVPYSSMIIAHEKMNIYAYMSLLEVTLKLAIVYILKAGNFDKLKLYAALFFIVTLINALLYRFYCSRKYPESSIKFLWDKGLYKNLFSFSVWDMYGSIAIISMGQGVNMLLNMFSGPALNAARGVAVNVQSAIAGFGNNFILASKPQTVKLFSEDKVDQMMKLVFSTSKYSFFLTYFLTLPILIETKFILHVWLKIPPDYSVVFCRLVLLNNLVWSLRYPIVTAFHAVGKIKMSNLVCGSLFYLVIIGSYICLKIGLPPESVFVVTIAVSILVQMSELLVLKWYVNYSISAFYKQVILIALLIMVISAIFPYLVSTIISSDIIRFLAVGFTSVITVSVSVYFIGLDRKTRKFIISKAGRILQKFTKKKA